MLTSLEDMLFWERRDKKRKGTGISSAFRFIDKALE